MEGNMRKTIALLGAVAIVAAVAFAPSAATAGSPVTVKVKDNKFKPNGLTVKKGTVIKFRWVRTRAPHNVTKASGPGKNFQSKTTKKKGVNFKKRFNRAGNYLLVCSVHDGMDMNLKVRK